MNSSGQFDQQTTYMRFVQLLNVVSDIVLPFFVFLSNTKRDRQTTSGANINKIETKPTIVNNALCPSRSASSVDK